MMDGFFSAITTGITSNNAQLEQLKCKIYTLKEWHCETDKWFLSKSPSKHGMSKNRTNR